MKNRLITALFVLLLTPGLLFAARPSISAQEQALTAIDQKLDETLAKIDAIDQELSAHTSSVDWPYSSDCNFCDSRVNPEWWNESRSSLFQSTDSESAKQICTTYCTANWSDQRDSCNEVCAAASTGELSDCSPDASASMMERFGFISSCAYGSYLGRSPGLLCQADPAAPICRSFADTVHRTLTCVASTAMVLTRVNHSCNL
jgi:hypothetical protein